MIIGIDFDGTCTTHEFPKIGRDIGAVPVLKKLVEAGNQLILFTMRSDYWKVGSAIFEKEEQLGFYKNTAEKLTYLSDAVQWFKDNDIPLYGIQTNPKQKGWTTSPKAYCQLYIDDAALGCPLIFPEDGSRPYVDWETVDKMLSKLQTKKP
jgi:hypothetical protein